MAGYLLCISYESGVPIFARKVGDLTPIAFPLAASLNGVKVFGKANRVELISTVTQSSRIVWKDFYDKISLIFAGTNDSPSDFHIEQALQNVFNALVLQNGLEEILMTKSVDKLKKEFRGSYPLIDQILQGLKPTERTLYFGELTACADVALHSESHSNFQNILESLMENIGCGYGCFTANGSIVAATKDWWCLSGEELYLLVTSAHQLPYPSSDAPVFLPKSSPNLPFRFVIFKLTENVRLCVLCGQEPSMPFIEKEVHKLKKTASDVFQMFHDKTSPFSHYSRYFSIDKSISGFLVVNLEKRRCAFSVFPEKPNDSLNTAHKLDLLRTFYRNIVGSIWDSTGSSLFSSPNSTLHQPHSKGDGANCGSVEHNALESYWASEYHKCHALHQSVFQLFVIYEAEISTLLMRMTSQKLLAELIKDRVMK